ncbi:probable E3 ubiquitin-protein ligase ZFP1 isoform X2 [Benincasa hispida]|uniref:probable E3 ubiquitin-protein ligase ZFP1 isoform X2 n=1 Tax=Benincasa hispida TaxID=102211 RepID=UPI0018FF5C0E|nr:probable E3 ubiquitin-protein ligase ZFP1 isoform X2 [Benincasa hispida]
MLARFLSILSYGKSGYNCTFMDIRERNRVLSHTPPTMDLELDRPSLLPELSLLGQGAFSQWSSHSMVTTSRNSMNPDVQHLPEHANGAVLYGVSQYNGSRIQCAQDIQVTTAANPCSYLTSPYGNQHFPSPRNGLIGNPVDTYARNSHFIEGGFPYKRRFSEGFPVSFQGPNSLASFESLNAPHAHSHLIRGDLMVQHLQPTNNALWLDQPVNFNLEDRSAWTWNQAPAGFPIHGDSGIRGFSESFNSGLHRYSEMSGISSPNFQHPPSTIIQHSSHPVPLPQAHLQGQRGQNISLHPQAAATTPRVPLNSPYGNMHQFPELELRQTRDITFGDRITYNPHQSCVDPETTFQRRLTYQMRVPEEDEVPIRGARASASDPNGIGDFADAYRDMRLDIEHMSYEELLALEERIGYVGTGLSEETITSQLKTRITMPSARDVNLEVGATSRNEETNSCTICLDVIGEGTKIGILDCEHYYHADCLKQWLLIKNVCPVCKSEALTR